MKVGLDSADKTAFPNLALLKISAWHKARGDDVSSYVPLTHKAPASQQRNTRASDTEAYQKVDKCVHPERF
jgi:hypothetical protein